MHKNCVPLHLLRWHTVVNNPSANAGDARDIGSIPGLGRSPGERGNLLQDSCLENHTDRGTWQATQSQACKESDTTEVT